MKKIVSSHPTSSDIHSGYFSLSNREKMIGQFFGIRETDIWKLFIDRWRQPSGNKFIFNDGEPGFLEGMLNGFLRVAKNIEDGTLLDAMGLIALHDAAVQYPDSNGELRPVMCRAPGGEMIPMELGLDRGEACFDKLDDKSLKTAEENIPLQKDIIDVFSRNGRLLVKRKNKYSNHKRRIDKANEIIQNYKQAMSKADCTDKKLKHIAWLCKQLEMFHLFQDGNQRTISFLLLNQELITNGLETCILPDPFCFDGHYDTDMLVEEIKLGQETARFYKTTNPAQITEFIAKLFDPAQPFSEMEGRLLCTLIFDLALLREISTPAIDMNLSDIEKAKLVLIQLSQRVQTERVNEMILTALHFLTQDKPELLAIFRTETVRDMLVDIGNTATSPIVMHWVIGITIKLCRENGSTLDLFKTDAVAEMLNRIEETAQINETIGDIKRGLDFLWRVLH